MQRRVLATKERIYSSIIEELKKAPLTEITDRNIISKAQVSSGTFYKYFRNHTDALRELENNLLKDYSFVLNSDLKYWHVEKLTMDSNSVKLIQNNLNNTFKFWNKNNDYLLVLVSKNSDKYFFDQLISETELQNKKILAKCKTKTKIKITSDKLKVDAFAHQLAAAEIESFIWCYKHLDYMSRKEIKEAVAETITNAPFNLIMQKNVA